MEEMDNLLDNMKYVLVYSICFVSVIIFWRTLHRLNHRIQQVGSDAILYFHKGNLGNTRTHNQVIDAQSCVQCNTRKDHFLIIGHSKHTDVRLQQSIV